MEALINLNKKYKYILLLKEIPIQYDTIFRSLISNLSANEHSDNIILYNNIYYVGFNEIEKEDYNYILKNGIAIKGIKYYAKKCDFKCDLIPMIIKYIHILSLSFIKETTGEYLMDKVIDMYIHKNLVTTGNKFPSYYLEKFRFPCNMSQDLLQLIFGIDTHNTNKPLNISDLQSYKFNNLSLITITIDIWKNKKSDYLHHLSIITQNDIYYLIHTFGEKFGFQIDILDKYEYDCLISALVNLENPQTVNNELVKQNTIMTLNKYFNYEVMIYNNCTIRKTNDYRILDNIQYSEAGTTYPISYIKVYDENQFKCLYNDNVQTHNTEFKCICNIAYLINKHKTFIADIINKYQTDKTDITAITLKKLKKELDAFNNISTQNDSTCLNMFFSDDNFWLEFDK